jgi:hypothetical protein
MYLRQWHGRQLQLLYGMLLRLRLQLHLLRHSHYLRRLINKLLLLKMVLQS